MGSLKRNNQLFDPIRKKWVAATPEEAIRQALIAHMLQDKGYPSAWIAVEKDLSQLPHLVHKTGGQLPKRRVDIVVFTRGEAPYCEWNPLLLVECKAVALDDLALQQLVGYHAYVAAPFIALANGEHLVTGCWNAREGAYFFQEGLPAYSELLINANFG